MPTMERKIKIGGKSLTIQRLTLKGWSSLEGTKKAMDDAVSTRDFDKYFLAIVRFIETASLPAPKIKWEEVPWFELLEFYAEVVSLNSPTLKFTILEGNKEKDKKLPWEYEGRSWYFWLHSFSEHYGWSEETIGNMDIDTALGLYQEISIDDQLKREWEWGLSERSYKYDKSTKQSVFQPLHRPSWMLPITPKQPVTIMMRKELVPVGNIIDLQEEQRVKRGIQNP